MAIELPKETEPERKELIRVESQKNYYIPTTNFDLPKHTNHARALGLRDLTSPTTKESVLTMSKMDRRAILTGNFLVAFQGRINDLRGTPNGLRRPIYPEMTFFTAMKHFIDLQSVGDGSARMEITSVLSVPEMGFGPYGGPGMGNNMLENIRRNFVQQQPDWMQEPKEKKHFWNR